MYANPNPQVYIDYYKHQAGNGLPGFQGTPTMYGSGLGGMFKALFRMAVPLFKSGFNIAKPHLKTAAKGIISDVVSNVISKKLQREQEGSGLGAIASRHVRRPPGRRSVTKYKKHKTVTNRVKVNNAGQRINKRSSSSSKRKLSIF